MQTTKNIMFIRKVEHNSKIIWLSSWLNSCGQPTGDQFATLKAAKAKAVELGIDFNVSKQRWVSV